MNSYVVGLAVVLLVVVPGHALAGLININTADAALLDTLPGIGPTKAAAIIDYRSTQGPFVRIEDIQEVKGIGPSTFAEIQSMITVSGGDSTVSAQPKSALPSSTKKQTVEPAGTTKVSEPTHAEEAVGAPEAATPLAASGAVRTHEGVRGLLASPWTLLFFGLVVVAGGALMIL